MVEQRAGGTHAILYGMAMVAVAKPVWGEWPSSEPGAGPRACRDAGA